MNFNPKDKDAEIDHLFEMIEQAHRITVFTGAGISTESGIPDYRSVGGLWSQMEPIQFNDFLTSEQARLEDWRRRFMLNEDFARAQPNAGHLALVRLYEAGKLLQVITQNIDGLHQKSGLPDAAINEIHGNSTYATCLECGEPYQMDWARNYIDKEQKSPTCSRCSGIVKAAVISFGQPMPEAKMRLAQKACLDCDLFMVLGSSLVVYPAAALPQIARQNGAQLIIINRESTPQDQDSDCVIHAEIGPSLERLMA